MRNLNRKKRIVLKEGEVFFDILINSNINWNFFNDFIPSRIILEYDLSEKFKQTILDEKFKTLKRARKKKKNSSH